MNLSSFIARRYFFSKKKTNAINIISGISMGVFLIGTSVMIIILSLLNGLEDLVKESNNSFDPDLKVQVVKGKVFDPKLVIQKIKKIEGIAEISEVLEENVVVRYADAQEIARVKGVDEQYTKVNQIDTLLLAGTTSFQVADQTLAIFGVDLANRLNINVNNEITSAEVIVPRKGAKFSSLDPSQSLNVKYLKPGGVLSITKDDEVDYLLAPIAVIRELLDYKSEVSALEIRLNEGVSRKTKKALSEALGEEFKILDRYEQNETAYNVFKSEKWLTFALLSLILLVAAFNAVGALTMLVLEKEKDLKILDHLGMIPSQIQKIYLKEGLYLSLSGAILGMLLGLSFCWLQMTYGLIKLEGSLIDFFPVRVRAFDIIAVLLVIVVMGILSSIYPARLAVKLGTRIGK